MIKKMLSIITALILSFATLSAYEVNGAQNFLSSKKETPQNDLYSYANKDYLKSAKIPNGYNFFNTDVEAMVLIDKQQREMIKDIIANHDKYDKSSVEYQIYAFYSSFLNEKVNTKNGIKPLQPIIDKINSCETVQQYVEAITEFGAEYGTSFLLPLFIMDDIKDSSHDAVYLGQCMTLITQRKGNTKEFDDAIRTYLKNLYLTLGYSKSDSNKKSKEMFDFLVELFESKKEPSYYFNIQNYYNPFSEKELCALFSNIDFSKVIEKSNYSKKINVNFWSVVDVDHAKKINSILVPEKLPILKEYFLVLLSELFYSRTTFANYKTTMTMFNKFSGIKDTYDPEGSALQLTRTTLPWQLSKIWVEKYFPEKTKTILTKMVSDIKSTYYTIIDEQDWLSSETKSYAKNKVKYLKVEIGYPENLDSYLCNYDFTSAEDGGTLIENFMKYCKGNCAQMYKNFLNKQVRFPAVPATVNCANLYTHNTLFFYAGYLIEPHFNPDADYATQLGSMGAVIAHEISHCFDINGANYTIDGKNQIWWKQSEYEEFQKRAQKIADFYSNEEIIPGMKANGTNLVSEIIADLGALKCVTKLCPDNQEDLQKLYISWANLWSFIATNKMLQQLNYFDPHPFGTIRVNSHMKNTDGFYKAFDVKPGDRLYIAPKDRVSIW